MKSIQPIEVPSRGIATQLSVCVVGDFCQIEEDAAANVSWQLFDAYGVLLNNGTVSISGEAYAELSVGNYYDNIWNTVCESKGFVLA